jgi:hypothetical protein
MRLLLGLLGMRLLIVRLLLALPVLRLLLLLPLSFLFFVFLLLRRFRLSEDDLRFRSARCP